MWSTPLLFLVLFLWSPAQMGGLTTKRARKMTEARGGTGKTSQDKASQGTKRPTIIIKFSKTYFVLKFKDRGYSYYGKVKLGHSVILAILD